MHEALPHYPACSYVGPLVLVSLHSLWRHSTRSSVHPLALLLSTHCGVTRAFRAWMIFLVLSRSMGTGAGPTPALWQALPQKGWSPKKGTMKVGLPVNEEREACGEG